MPSDISGEDIREGKASISAALGPAPDRTTLTQHSLSPVDTVTKQRSGRKTEPGYRTAEHSQGPTTLQASLTPVPNLAFQHRSSHSKPRFPAPFLPLQASLSGTVPHTSKLRFPAPFLPFQTSLSETFPTTPSLAFRHPSSHSKPRFPAPFLQILR